MYRLWLVVPLALALAGCDAGAGKKADGASCRSDGECASGYCECFSACRSGCCRERPKEPVMCTMNCTDLVCSQD